MIPRQGGGGPGIGTADRTKLSSHHAANAAYYTADLRRRSAAAQRFPTLGCGCRDPWRCQCDNADATPSDREIEAYAAAVRHLAAIGLTAAPRLPEMRNLWKRSPADRKIVATVASNWEIGT